MKTFGKLALLAVIPMMAACCGGNSSEEAAATTENQVVETIMARRSIRQYKDQPVSRETMDTIVKCGINAPNGMNRQAWEVRVVSNPDYINGATKLFAEANPRMAEDPTFKNMFRNAPTVVFIANDSAAGMSQIDCGMLGENMVLAAQSLGVGSCVLGGPIAFLKTPAAAEYLAKLGFSEGYELLYAIAFGYPDEAPDAKPRDEGKVVFLN